ncbi:MAG: hypothetical protein JST19_04265 [Bacteroidetes bacterium]|nr:hypothetical protein [Bacteroidota bacterium]
MKKIALIACMVILSVASAFADKISIDHFEIKDNPFAKNEIAIVATDTAHNVLENVNGIFAFMVNGFQENLHFDKGTAFYRHKLDKSIFLYVRHENESGTHAGLYYVYAGSDKLIPVHISWIVLIAIPAILILLAYMFRKLIIVAIILFVLFVYFNHHSGLGIGTFFESVFDGLKGMFK